MLVFDLSTLHSMKKINSSIFSSHEFKPEKLTN